MPGTNEGGAGRDGSGGLLPHLYLDGLSGDHRALLERANRAGLRVLRGYLADEQAVAFLGAGASMPLYPLWTAVVNELWWTSPSTN